MAASKLLLDAVIQFKLGRAPPSELLTDSNSAARAFCQLATLQRQSNKEYIKKIKS
jgi:hypothetical protein